MTLVTMKINQYQNYETFLDESCFVMHFWYKDEACTPNL